MDNFPNRLPIHKCEIPILSVTFIGCVDLLSSYVLDLVCLCISVLFLLKAWRIESSLGNFSVSGLWNCFCCCLFWFCFALFWGQGCASHCVVQAGRNSDSCLNLLHTRVTAVYCHDWLINISIFRAGIIVPGVIPKN